MKQHMCICRINVSVRTCVEELGAIDSDAELGEVCI